MISVNVNNEFGKLNTVILGIAQSFGGTPKVEECYDPKSKEHVIKGTFPKENELIQELENFSNVLEKYDVKILKPSIIENYNQIFTRDLAFVIGNKIVVSNIIQDRQKEYSAIEKIISKINPQDVIRMEKNCRIEGGDVIPNSENIFIGFSKEDDFKKYKVARTNEAAIKQMKTIFPQKNVIAFELKKSDIDPKENALHLDCCFQPIGNGFVILYEDGFKNKSDVDYIHDLFGDKKLIKISKEEMYQMNSNIFSISDDVIVSETGFSRLNNNLRQKGFIVEEVKFNEIAKMEGLLRCTTLPLIRE